MNVHEKLEDARKYIGTKVIYEAGGLNFDCYVIGVSHAFGKVFYEITPVSGTSTKKTNKVTRKLIKL